MTTKLSAKVITFDSLDELIDADLPQEVKEAIAKLIDDEDTPEVTLESLDEEYRAALDKAKEAKIAEVEKLRELVRAGKISKEESISKGAELLISSGKEAASITKKYHDKAKELGLIPEEQKEDTESCSCNKCKEMDAEAIKEENAKVLYAEEIAKDAQDFLRSTQGLDTNSLHPSAKEAFNSAATLVVFALLEMGKIK